jgi:alpha-beta hydrolase superfamily lysophospholipase
LGDYEPVRSLFATRRRRLAARIVLYGGAIFVGLPLAASQILVGTIRSTAGQPRPPWTETSIASGDLRLRAWIADGEPGQPSAVVVHGLGDSLDAYADTGAILNRRGHAVLLLDLRGHGGSEGRLTTLGGHEREDVRAALRTLRERGLGDEGFVLFGVSMGAVAVIRAAAEETDVRAVVAEAPFDSYRSTVTHHARLFYGLPEWFPLIPATIGVAEWRAGFDADDIDTVDAARRMQAPLLLIVDGDDPRMPEAVVRRVFEAHPGPRRLWVAEAAPHSGGSLAPGYWETVLAFLDEHGL